MTGVQTCALPICFPVTIVCLGLGVRPVTGGYMVRCGHDYIGYTRDLEEAKRMYLDAVNKKRQTNDQL